MYLRFPATTKYRHLSRVKRQVSWRPQYTRTHTRHKDRNIKNCQE